jgi:putative transposase
MAYWKDEIAPELPEWCDPIPFQIKKIAVRDAINALKEGKKRVKKGVIPYFRLRFRSRKNPVQSCFIPSSAIKESGIYPRVSGKGLRFAEPFPESLMDSRLVFRNGKFYLAMPRRQTVSIAENQGRRVVAIDPGIRSFHTFYSPDVSGHIGHDDFSRIVRLGQHLDDLISRASNQPKQKKRRMMRAAGRMREKIKNLVDELHHKTARFYVDNFDVILLPTFETSEMARKATRKIQSKSVRSLMSFAHYRFSEFLKHKAFEAGKVVVAVTEEYTSKTNPLTGELMNVGSSRRINLGSDWINRDKLGAFNIMLKALGDSPDCLQVVAVSES